MSIYFSSLRTPPTVARFQPGICDHPWQLVNSASPLIVNGVLNSREALLIKLFCVSKAVSSLSSISLSP
ncbi:hypothetical protein CS542_05045 [Pedobacter sp. IW39]|nr:hypothetical protein CS542_05045 [Pedobacter sp. IW39]